MWISCIIYLMFGARLLEILKAVKWGGKGVIIAGRIRV